MEPSESESSSKKKIIVERFNFFLEVLIVFIVIFIFLLIPRALIWLLINENSILFGPIYYLTRALAIFVAVLLALFIVNLLFDFRKGNISEEVELSPASEFLKLYSIPNGKVKDQLLNGVLILFIVFIPLDFLIYFLFPEMLQYTGVLLTSQKTDSYLLANYSIFLFSVIIIQISVSVYEETLTRGYLTKRGRDYFHKMSAVIIPSLYFGFMHFIYYLNPLSKNYPIWWPFIWFLNTLFVGILLSIFILKKKSIFPVIFAHAANNIISAHAIWCYLHGISFAIVTIYMYLPLLIVSAILFALQFKKIKRALSNGLKFLKSYFKIDKHTERTKGDVYFRIFIDFLISILILIVGLFLV